MTIGDRPTSVTLSPDAVDLCVTLLEIDVLPVVLGRFSVRDDPEERTRAHERERADLLARGLIDDGELDPSLVDRFAILARPAFEIAMRVFAGESVLRLCLAQDAAERSVLAIRGPESVVFQDITLNESAATWSAPVVRAVGRVAPAAIGGVSAPTQSLTEAFAAAEDGEAVAAFLRLGASEDDAAALAELIGSIDSYAEIVAITHGEGTVDQAPGAVVIYNSEHGRVVGSPSIAPDGTLWSTLTAGSDHRITQAIGSLLETAGLRIGS